MKRWLNRHFIKLLVVFAIILSLFASFIFLYKFHSCVFDQNTFSQFGNYIGGVLSPILTFFTIIILVVTLQVERHELRIARVEAVKKDLLDVLKDIDCQLKEVININKKQKKILEFKHINDVILLYEFLKQLSKIDPDSIILEYYLSKYISLIRILRNHKNLIDESYTPMMKIIYDFFENSLTYFKSKRII